MGMRREDSVLVALGELRRLQDERRQEEEDAERQRQDELRLAREAEERRAREEEARRKLEQEEALRREAEKKARLEREERIRIQQEAARAEAEARVRAEHEWKLHRMTFAARRGARIPWLPVGVGAAVIIGVAFWLVQSKSQLVELALTMAEQKALEARQAGEETDRLRAELGQCERQIEELKRRRAVEPPRDEPDRKAAPAAGPKRRFRTGKAVPKSPARDARIKVDLDPHNPIGGLEGD